MPAPATPSTLAARYDIACVAEIPTDEVETAAAGQAAHSAGVACQPESFHSTPRLQTAWARGWQTADEADRTRRGMASTPRAFSICWVGGRQMNFLPPTSVEAYEVTLESDSYLVEAENARASKVVMPYRFASRTTATAYAMGALDFILETGKWPDFDKPINFWPCKKH